MGMRHDLAIVFGLVLAESTNARVCLSAPSEEHRAEGDEPIKLSERATRHEQVHPRIKTEAAGHQVAHGRQSSRLEFPGLGSPYRVHGHALPRATARQASPQPVARRPAPPLRGQRKKTD